MGQALNTSSRWGGWSTLKAGQIRHSRGGRELCTSGRALSRRDATNLFRRFFFYLSPSFSHPPLYCPSASSSSSSKLRQEKRKRKTMFGHQATNSSLNRDRFRGKRSFCFGFFSSGGIRPWPSHFCITIDHLFVVIAATTKHRERQPKKKRNFQKVVRKKAHCSPLCLFFFVSWQSDTASVLCLATFLLGICYTSSPKLQV